MNADEFEEMFVEMIDQLRDSGRLSEILDDQRQVIPTEAALRFVCEKYPNDSPEKRFHRARAKTLIEFVLACNGEQS
jgi:hypothetical protein